MSTEYEENIAYKNGKFINYPHIDKLKANQNINFSECRIFPKLDGSNCQINFDTETNQLKFGSRNRTITNESDMSNFVKKFSKNENILNFFKENKELTLFGEYLIPNRKKLYKKEFEKEFIIFDVVVRDEYFLDYDEYKLLLDKFNLLYIEPLAINDNQTIDEIVSSLKTKFINDNAHDEGIVIKKKGKFLLDTSDRVCKIICDEWSQINDAKRSRINNIKNQNQNNDLNENVFEELKATYCTMSYINKELEKLFPQQQISNESKDLFTTSLKEDINEYGKKKVINLIMNDFVKIELASLRNTEYAKYIKRLADCMAVNLQDLF
jgi:hypothetical protein